jgi:hypothetical protein
MRIKRDAIESWRAFLEPKPEVNVVARRSSNMADDKIKDVGKYRRKESDELFEKNDGGKGAKTLRVGDKVLEITDPLNIQPASADVLTEYRLFSNLICVSFANIVTDGSANPEVRVSARIRLPLTTATDLRNVLDELLRDAMPGKNKAN